MKVKSIGTLSCATWRIKHAVHQGQGARIAP